MNVSNFIVAGRSWREIVLYDKVFVSASLLCSNMKHTDKQALQFTFIWPFDSYIFQ